MYRKNDYFQKNIKSLYEEIDRSSEIFIKHYKQTYTTPAYPPA
jgi:hypothetical protein